MGADLYIGSIYEQRKKELRVDELMAEMDAIDGAKFPEKYKNVYEAWSAARDKALEGCYFRDSYNESSLAWVCGLSYWEAADHTDEDGTLHLNETKRWHDVLVAADIPTLVNKRIMEDKLHLTDGDTLDNAVDYFTEKRKRFVTFLAKCLELGEGPEWSV